MPSYDNGEDEGADDEDIDDDDDNDVNGSTCKAPCSTIRHSGESYWRGISFKSVEQAGWMEGGWTKKRHARGYDEIVYNGDWFLTLLICMWPSVHSNLRNRRLNLVSIVSLGSCFKRGPRFLIGGMWGGVGQRSVCSFSNCYEQKKNSGTKRDGAGMGGGVPVYVRNNYSSETFPLFRSCHIDSGQHGSWHAPAWGVPEFEQICKIKPEQKRKTIRTVKLGYCLVFSHIMFTNEL